MLNEMTREPYGCLTSFSHLNGRTKQEVVVGTHPVARLGKLLFNDKVKRHYRTHRPSKHNVDCIAFENGKRFDVLNQTINGKQRYIFPCTLEIDFLWRRQLAKDKVMGFPANASAEAKAVAAELIWERLPLNGRVPLSRRFWEEQAVAALDALSVRELEDLAALLVTPQATQAPPVQGCAA